MDAPPVKYVQTSDGYSIAYAVTGDGPPLVFLPWAFDHVQLAWQFPGLDAWLPKLAERFTLIQLDLRGTGMSTRGLSEEHVFEDYVKDVEAVVAHLGLKAITLYGVITGGHVAAMYALFRPERVAALVLSSPWTSRNLQRAAALFGPNSQQDWDFFLYSLMPRDRTPDETRRRVELLKQAYDQKDYGIRMRTAPSFDEERLTGIKVPILVLHARDYAIVDASQPMRVAQLTSAQLVTIDGSDAFGDPQAGTQAIETFVADRARHEQETKAHEKEDMSLSQRELDVLRLIARGRSNAQIAEELVISPNTVGRHVSNIFDKTGAANRTEAAAYARDHGVA